MIYSPVSQLATFTPAAFRGQSSAQGHFRGRFRNVDYGNDDGKHPASRPLFCVRSISESRWSLLIARLMCGAPRGRANARTRGARGVNFWEVEMRIPLAAAGIASVACLALAPLNANAAAPAALAPTTTLDLEMNDAPGSA